jgi:hypothetical protein
MLFWRRMEKISWTYLVTNEEVFKRVKEMRNILQTVKRRMASWISHILRRNCFLKHVVGVEGKIRGKDRSDEKKRKKT